MGNSAISVQSTDKPKSVFGLYFGSRYNPSKFVSEALKIGVNRAISPANARRLAYGDHVVMCYWNSQHPVAVCEFRVSSITFNSEVSDKIGAELISEGRCIYEDGGGANVDRECGGYAISGTYHVDGSVELGEILDKAIKIAGEMVVKLNTYVGGAIVKVYDPHAPLLGDPSFVRGLFDIKHGLSADGVMPIPLTQAEAKSRKVVAIDGYHRK